VTIPKDGWIVEFLKSEGFISQPAIRRALKSWQERDPRPALGPFLIEQEALKVDQYVALMSKLDVRVQPCQQCQAPRYVPSRPENASPCRRCNNQHPPSEISHQLGSPLYFEDYELKKMLGRGAMGVVYQATYRPANRTEALKIMLPRLGNERRSKRFDRESAVLAKLRHRNIVGVHRGGEYAGLKFLSLNFVDGGDLKEYLKENELSIPQICNIVAQIADGLTAAHRLEVIHRDLKPANIFIDRQGIPLIGDFGLAIDLIESSRLTRTGAAIGTPYYMSPEQLMGAREDVGPQSDVYALGVILYQMVTGKRPYEAKSIPELKHQIETRSYPVLSSFRDDVPEALENLCKRLLEPDMKLRIQNTEELKDALEWIANPRGAEPEICQVRKKSIAPVIGSLITIFLIGLGALYATFSDSGSVLEDGAFKRRVRRFTERQNQDLETLIKFIPGNPHKKLEELVKIRSRIEKIQKTRGKLFFENGGQQLFDRLSRAEAYANWLIGGATGRQKAIKLLSKTSGPVDIRLDLARMRLYNGESEECGQILSQIKEKLLSSEQRERFFLVKAEHSFLKGEFSQSLNEFDQVKTLTYRELALKVEAAAVQGQAARVRKALAVDKDRKGSDFIDKATLRALSLARLSPEEAWRQLNTLQKRNLHNPRSQRARALFLSREGWPEAGLEDLTNSIAGTTEILDRWLSIVQIGHFHLQAGSFLDAKSNYQELLNLVQGWVPPRNVLSLTRNLIRRKKLDSIRSQALLGLGDIAALELNAKEADRYYGAAMEADPADSRAPVRRARSLLRRGALADLGSLLKRCLAYEGTDVSPRLLQGEYALQKGDSKLAERAFSTAFARAATSAQRADTLLGLAKAIEMAGRSNEAKHIRIRAAQHDREDVVFRRGQRLIYQLAGPLVQNSDQVNLLKRQIRRQVQLRSFPAALNVLEAGLSLSTRRFSESKKSLIRAKYLNDQLWEYYLFSGFWNYQKGRFTDASNDFKSAENLGAPGARAPFNLARCLKKLNREADALEAINIAIEREPWRKTVYELRILLYQALKMKDKQEADIVRVESYQPAVNQAFEDRISEAFQSANRDELWELCWERPGRALTLYDFGRLLGVAGVSIDSLAFSLLCLAQSVYRCPFLELNLLEFSNQLISFGNRQFLEAVDKEAKRQPRFVLDRYFTLGALELFQWITSKQKIGSLIKSLSYFEKILDHRPDHQVAQVYHSFVLGLLGYDKVACKRLAKLPSTNRYLAPHFMLAVIKARIGDTVACYLELSKSNAKQRLSIMKEFRLLFPDDMQRSTSFKAATGLK
jgi:serine/threonine protein kinase